jgi:hypothetical protein
MIRQRIRGIDNKHEAKIMSWRLGFTIVVSLCVTTEATYYSELTASLICIYKGLSFQ